jgi:hypothetical protein
MPRPAKTRASRTADIGVAILDLPKLFGAAMAAEAQYGANAQETLRAWEAVEVNGATVHRQARILAGKSRGG